MMIIDKFDPIQSDEMDTRAFDFSRDLPPGEKIVGVVWRCAALPSGRPDPEAASRLKGSPDFTETVTGHVLSGCLSGVNYVLEATVATTSGNRVSLWAVMPCLDPPV
jgi:hypothetical protein